MPCQSIRSSLLAFLILTSAFLFAQDPSGNLREIHVNASQVYGTIRSLQGVNGVPTPIMAGLPNLVKQYKDLHIDVIRTHDTMGPTDISAQFSVGNPLLAWLVPDNAQRAKIVNAGNAANLFPDWNADPDKPESYHFGPTDRVIEGIRATGADVYYRIGRSWGADYTPLPDLNKFAAVVKHVAMHYNRGWDHGYQNSVRYWEFWNEDDTPFFWTDSPETFYKLYEKTARALKSVDPATQVGANAIAFPLVKGPFREGFLDYCAEHQVPLDFYSWHHYTIVSADPYDFVRIGNEIRQTLNDHGFPRAKSVLSEWNLTPDFTDPEKPRLQGITNAAFIDDALIYMQDSSIDMAEFYRADAAWMGLFDTKGNYFKPAYSFVAAGKMLATPERLTVTGSDLAGLAILAGRSEDGNTIQILVSNYQVPQNYHPRIMMPPPGSFPKNMPAMDFANLPVLKPRDLFYAKNGGFHLVVEDLPWKNADFTVQRYRLTATEDFAPARDSTGKGDRFDLSEQLPPPGVELIVLKKK